ncbi:hypothetical protein C2845_PM15G21190 [Panicum miliaceum]|uniref:Uncharacterized protein n=1 Tax=Panicum miliaceum TaxID=4540 RepID=A0A3L6QDM0_PANMI|nr:hypothetical protein C2845_PM15G21190 [Panicum miliaceum]
MHKPAAATASCLLAQAASSSERPAACLPSGHQQGASMPSKQKKGKRVSLGLKYMYLDEKREKILQMSCITKCQRFKGRFSEVDVLSSIIAKPIVWNPIIAIFSMLALGGLQLHAAGLGDYLHSFSSFLL